MRKKKTSFFCIPFKSIHLNSSSFQTIRALLDVWNKSKVKRHQYRRELYLSTYIPLKIKIFHVGIAIFTYLKHAYLLTCFKKYSHNAFDYIYLHATYIL